MDWTQIAITAVTVLLSSGIIQFFVTRKDKKKEDAKTDHDEAIKKELKDHLTNVNDKWKETYCDKNAQAIAELTKEVKQGLEEREAMGRKRYDEHHLSIEKMSLQHQKDFQTLLEAIKQLENNDTRVTESLDKIANKQETMAESLIGMSHDKLIFMTDKIAERGAITLKEKATLESIYVPYHKLGGNSHCSTAMEYMKTLPVVSDEEAKNMDAKKTG